MHFNHSVWMGLHDHRQEEHFEWTSGIIHSRVASIHISCSIRSYAIHCPRNAVFIVSINWDCHNYTDQKS